MKEGENIGAFGDTPREDKENKDNALNNLDNQQFNFNEYVRLITSSIQNQIRDRQQLFKFLEKEKLRNYKEYEEERVHLHKEITRLEKYLASLQERDDEEAFSEKEEIEERLALIREQYVVMDTDVLEAEIQALRKRLANLKEIPNTEVGKKIELKKNNISIPPIIEN